MRESRQDKSRGIPNAPTRMGIPRYPKTWTSDSAHFACSRERQEKSDSNRDPLDLIERDLIAGAVIELRRARAGVVGHRLGVFERAAVGEEIREPRRAEGVAAHVGVDGGFFGAAADHAPDIDAVHRQRRQRAAMPVGGAEQGSPFRPEQPGSMHVGVEIGFEIVMRRHLMDLAAFFVEAEPPALAVGEVILDAHADRRADAGEAEGHQRDQRAVAQADDGRDVDGVEQLARLRRRQHRRLAALDGVLRPAHRVAPD